MSDDIQTLEQKRAQLQAVINSLIEPFGSDWLDKDVDAKVNALHSEIYYLDHALHAQYGAQGLLRRLLISRAMIHHLQQFFKREPLHNQEITFPYFEVHMIHVYPTHEPLVKRFVFPFHRRVHSIDITCHIDDLMRTLEAMDTVDVVGELL